MFVDRTVFVKGVWFRKGQDDWEQCHLAWDRIQPNGEQPINLVFDRLQLAGNHRVEVVIGLATRWRWREEIFAFSAGIEVRVEGDKEVVVQQNINYAADAPQTGATIYAPIRISNELHGNTLESPTAPQEIGLVRARVYERSFGWRGTRIEDARNSKKKTSRDGAAKRRHSVQRIFRTRYSPRFSFGLWRWHLVVWACQNQKARWNLRCSAVGLSR